MLLLGFISLHAGVFCFLWFFCDRRNSEKENLRIKMCIHMHILRDTDSPLPPKMLLVQPCGACQCPPAMQVSTHLGTVGHPAHPKIWGPRQWSGLHNSHEIYTFREEEKEHWVERLQLPTCPLVNPISVSVQDTHLLPYKPKDFTGRVGRGNWPWPHGCAHHCV